MSAPSNIPARLSFERNVPEARLLELGLATPDECEVDCFSLDNNRLILLDGVPCGAVVTQADFTKLAIDGVEEVVAIEILPAFRRQGIACAVFQLLARDGRVRVNSPCESLSRALASLGSLAEGDCSIFELRIAGSPISSP